MTDIQLDAGTLTASEETRTATGLLVPFNEEGRSNLGRVKVNPGAITIPTDLTGVVANLEHDREQPVGALLAASATDAGIVATIGFANTPAGNAALADIASGKRKHLSVEAAGIKIRDGAIVAGRLFAAALVAKPAFPSATLLASDTGDEEDGTETPENTASETEPLAAPNQEDTMNTEQETAAVPQTLVATAPSSSKKKTEVEKIDRGMNLRTLYAALAQAHATKDPALLARLQQEGIRASTIDVIKSHDVDESTLLAALTDIKTTGAGSIGTAQVQPQWLGELTDKRAFQRRYIPLFGHGELSGFQVAGFSWGTKPTGGSWGGNKAAIPSNAPTVTSYAKDAVGWAMGHDIDRKFRDFNVPGFWESYFQAGTDDYLKQSDTSAIADVVAGATAVTAGTVPVGVPSGLVSIIDGALAILDNQVPSFAIVAKDVWRSILLTPYEQTLQYLSTALGLESGELEGFKIVPARGTDITSGKVLVGHSSAVDVLELPGSPLRVEGLDMVKGGIDPGMFGYYVTVIVDAASLALVTPAA